MDGAGSPLDQRNSEAVLPTADGVAAVIAGVPSIGLARQAIEDAGWRSSVAGNRITVNDRVFARYIEQAGDQPDLADPRWVVYGIGERPVVRIVASGNQV